MKIIFLFTILIFVVSNCGKKSDPKYQSNIKQQAAVIS